MGAGKQAAFGTDIKVPGSKITFNKKWGCPILTAVLGMGKDGGVK